MDATRYRLYRVKLYFRHEVFRLLAFQKTKLQRYQKLYLKEFRATKNFYAKDKKREDDELAYIENLKKAGERNKQRREHRESTTETKED